MTCRDPTLEILLSSLIYPCFGMLITSLDTVRQFGSTVNLVLIREAIHHSLASVRVISKLIKSFLCTITKKECLCFGWAVYVKLFRNPVEMHMNLIFWLLSLTDYLMVLARETEDVDQYNERISLGTAFLKICVGEY